MNNYHREEKGIMLILFAFIMIPMIIIASILIKSNIGQKGVDEQALGQKGNYEEKVIDGQKNTNEIESHKDEPNRSRDRGITQDVGIDVKNASADKIGAKISYNGGGLTWRLFDNDFKDGFGESHVVLCAVPSDQGNEGINVGGSLLASDLNENSKSLYKRFNKTHYDVNPTWSNSNVKAACDLLDQDKWGQNATNTDKSSLHEKGLKIVKDGAKYGIGSYSLEMYKSSLNKTKAWSEKATGQLEISADSTGYKYTGAWKAGDFYTQEWWLTTGRNKIYMNRDTSKGDYYRFLSSASCYNSGSLVDVRGSISRLSYNGCDGSHAVVPCVLF